MTKNQFLNLKFPVLSYFRFKRGASTKYNESFHVENINNKQQLNFWYDVYRKNVTVSFYDSSQIHEKDKLKNIKYYMKLDTDLINIIFKEYLI